ncbi:MAG: hypothetical protein ACRDFX_11505 [Chloroflexota bacterium]
MKARLIGALILCFFAAGATGVPTHASASGVRSPLSGLPLVQLPGIGNPLASSLLPQSGVPDYEILAASETCDAGPGTCTLTQGSVDIAFVDAVKLGNAAIGTPDAVIGECEKLTRSGTTVTGTQVATGVATAPTYPNSPGGSVVGLGGVVGTISTSMRGFVVASGTPPTRLAQYGNLRVVGADVTNNVVGSIVSGGFTINITNATIIDSSAPGGHRTGSASCRVSTGGLLSAGSNSLS